MMSDRPEFYIPVAYIEALGWATVAHKHLELAVDILTVMVARWIGDETKSLAGPGLYEQKIDYLRALPAASLKRLEWVGEARAIGDSARQLDFDYQNAASSILYSRGGGNLEWLMRTLTERAGVSQARLNMTPRKIDKLTLELRNEARRACGLAETMMLTMDRERRSNRHENENSAH